MHIYTCSIHDAFMPTLLHMARAQGRPRITMCTHTFRPAAAAAAAGSYGNATCIISNIYSSSGGASLWPHASSFSVFHVHIIQMHRHGAEQTRSDFIYVLYVRSHICNCSGVLCSRTKRGCLLCCLRQSSTPLYLSLSLSVSLTLSLWQSPYKHILY